MARMRKPPRRPIAPIVCLDGNMKTENVALQAAIDHYNGVRDTYIKTLEGKGYASMAR